MDWLDWESLRPWLLSNGLRILLVVALAWIAMRLLKMGIQRFANRYRERRPDAESGKRIDTLAAILRVIGSLAIFITAGLILLSQLGVKLGPILGVAGIGGLAVGFGAQNLVRDVISGFFILLEDQVRVGDVVQLNGQGGLVEAVTLRYIRLRDLSGTVHYFPNGTITQVSNMTKEFSFYVVDMGVAYREDTDEVARIMREVLEQMRQEEPWNKDVLEPLEILGVDKFADSAVVVKARIKTQALRQWAAGREFNRRVKKAFDEQGIEIPFPHQTIYWGEGKEGQPATLHVKGLTAENKGAED